MHEFSLRKTEKRKDGFMRDKQGDKALFRIQINGITGDENQYHFDIDNQLFEQYPEEEIKQAKASAEVVLFKRPNVTEMDISIKGFVALTCDRCLSEFNYNFELSETAILKEAGKNQDNEINIIIFEPEKGEIELDQYFYDMIMTALPIQRVHEAEEDCDQDMIERIEENKKKGGDIDPRWNGLKDLI